MSDGVVSTAIEIAYREGYTDGEIDALDKLLHLVHQYVQDGSKINYRILRQLANEVKGITDAEPNR